MAPVATRLDKPIVLSPHGTLNLATGRSGLKTVWDRLLSPGLALRVDHVVALSEAERAEAENLWRRFGKRQRPTRFSVVPNGVDPPEFDQSQLAADFRERYNLGESPIVLFMGRLQKRKGVNVLIEAFQAAAVEDARLLIVGPDEGMLPTLTALADGDPRVVFTGYLAGEARLGALAAGDVFALPATGEGQPMAALEAMAAGMPAVLSPGCNLDEAEAAGAGYVVEASVAAFAEKLNLLLEEPALRQAMGRRARRLVAERFSWERVAVALEDVYVRLL